jgi:hypothetical protein
MARKLTNKNDYFTRAVAIFSSAIVLITSSAAAQGPTKKSDLTKADRAAWHKLLGWPADCERAFQKTYANEDFAGLEFYQLGERKYVVHVTCYSGAYQPGQQYVFYDETKSSARLLRFKLYERETNGTVRSHYETEISGLPEFDRKKKELTVFSKARGIGDCGSVVIYRFFNGRSIPREARAQACYDASSKIRSIDPDYWPRVKKL